MEKGIRIAQLYPADIAGYVNALYVAGMCSSKNTWLCSYEMVDALIGELHGGYSGDFA